jgi:FtsZ-interacting cell division protein ZipA
MHFVIRFYNKHQIDFASSNVIDSDDRRIKSNQHEERIAFNLDQYESDHERNANERTTRMQQQATTRIKRTIRAKAHIVQNDNDEEPTREKQASTQESTRKKQTSTQTKEIATTRVQEKKKKTTSSSSEKSTTSKEKKMTQTKKAKTTNN